MNYNVKLSDEVREALALGRPVIALESTIIAHGMPYPQNVKTALACERLARTHGAVPATIAIIGGQLCAGLTEEQIEYLGREGRNVAKVSRRDIPYIMVKGADGATTVAATMFIASLAGIKVFATGGIGGVHRGAETTMDISADLTELGRTPVAVVCAGAKSVLDIGLTLEYLETQGVPVVGFRTNKMPAFYTRDSGYNTPCRCDSVEELSDMVGAMANIPMRSGMVIVNPIPKEFEADEDMIDRATTKALREAEKNGITVIKHYIDRAFSAKTDNRPEFQQMIKDSSKKLFDVVLVWKFDRFARNRFDSANYKMILKKNGVHLISVMEPIAEGSQGILVETLLEGMAEYYSAELSEKVIRGQTENALKGKCTGGTGTIGYKIDDDKFYHLDPLTSPLVLEAFQRYDNGDKMVEIVNFLNDKGVRNMQGGKMTHSSVNTMLKNRRYIGELSFRDIVVPDAIPVIVPKDLFDRVQKRLDKNKRAPACGKADEEYLLTTKLFCGKCGALMFGESGTSATGRTYYYYKCANVKRRKGCNKKTVQKEWLEDLVVRETMKLIQDDAVIDKIVQLVMDVQNQENTTIPLLEKQLREVNKKLDNLMKAIEDGLYTRTTKERLEALEIQKDELTAKIADEKLKKPSFNEDFIRFWLMKFRKFDISQKKQRKTLIEIFVNAIFLYDDRMLITFNYKDGTQTVRFEDTLTADSAEEKSSDLSGSAGS